MKRKILFLYLVLVVSAYFTILAYASTTDVKLELSKKECIGLNDIINVKITAPNANINSKMVEYLLVQVYTSEDPVGIYVYITETNKDTGIFSGNITFSYRESDSRSKILKVANPTNIYVKYAGIIEQTAWRPEEMNLAFDKAAYYGYGVLPVVTLTNKDLNRDKTVAEVINVRVTSTSDPTGINLRLLEKTVDAGVFTSDFGFDRIKSDDQAKRLRVSYNDAITVIYETISYSSGKLECWTSTSSWKPSTGVVKLDKASYSGLLSIATVTMNDQDLNLRPNHIDSAKMKITSGSDPNGIILSAYETDENKGVFSANFGFSTNTSDSGKKTIKINPTDTITAVYIDENTEDNIHNTAITATSPFQLEEAKIETSAEDDKGIGNIIEIFVTEPDANNPKMKDRIIAKVGTADKTDELTIWLEESGVNTGKFKCNLYLNEDKLTANSLLVAATDRINIKYLDNTVPEGGKKEILKSVNWAYQSTVLKMDKESYTGYNSTAKITLINMTLNKDETKADYVDVKIRTLSSGNITLELKETGNNSGQFTGTLRFGRSSKHSDGVIKVSGSDIVTVTYVNEKDKDDVTECSADWFAQDGELILDREEYSGEGSPVKITLYDLDISEDPQAKDEVKVSAKLVGSTKDTSVTLVETNKNSGVFEGTLYINGRSGERPSITLKPSEEFEVIYVDEDTSAGVEENRTATAIWNGISTPKLVLDKPGYIGYDTYIIISLEDPDQNKSTTSRDKVTVQIKTKSGKTKSEYTLTETGSDTGVFTLKAKFVNGDPANSRIRVSPSDEVTVIFEEKKASATAAFSEK